MAETTPSERETVNLGLTSPARAVIDGIRESTGVPKTEALTRILEWFASLPVKLRLAVLNRDQDTQRELVRAVLSDMAAIESAAPGQGQPVPVSIEQATRIIRIMCGHVDRLTLARSNREAAAAPAGPAAASEPPPRRRR